MGSVSEFPTPDTEITHILIVDDVGRSRAWYLDVLGASLYREYGGTSVVLRFAGAWLLLTTGGPPTDDKQGVTLAAPREPATSTTCSRSASTTVRRCTRRSAVAARRSLRRP